MYGLATRLPRAAASLRGPALARLNSTASSAPKAPRAKKGAAAAKSKSASATPGPAASSSKPTSAAAAPSPEVAAKPAPASAMPADAAPKTAPTAEVSDDAKAGAPSQAAAPAPPASKPQPASSEAKPVDTPPTPPSTSAAKATSKKVSAPIPRRPTVTLQPYREHPEDPEERAYHADVVHGRASTKAYRHPAPYKVPVATLHFRSHFPQLLDVFTHFVEHAAASLAVPVGGTARLPTRRTLWTVIKGPFVHKKSQENFERRVHKRALIAYDADPEVVDRWVAYLKKHAMAGVGMRIARWHRVPVGIGRHQLEAIAGRMRLGKVPPRDQILQLGQQVIAAETKAAMAVKPEDEHVAKA